MADCVSLHTGSSPVNEDGDGDRDDDDDAGSLKDFIVNDDVVMDEPEPKPKPVLESDLKLDAKSKKRARAAAFLEESKSLIVEGKRSRKKPKTAEETFIEYKESIKVLEKDIDDAKHDLAVAQAAGDKEEVENINTAIIIYREKLDLAKYNVRELVEASELYARECDVDLGKLKKQLEESQTAYSQLEHDIDTVPGLPQTAINAMKKQRQTLFRKITKLQDTINACAEDTGLVDGYVDDDDDKDKDNKDKIIGDKDDDDVDDDDAAEDDDDVDEKDIEEDDDYNDSDEEDDEDDEEDDDDEDEDEDDEDDDDDI